MSLSERSLGWLRRLDREVRPDGARPPGRPAPATVSDPVTTAFAVALCARRTPAWTERHLALLDALTARRRTAPDAGPDRFAADAALAVLLGLRDLVEAGQAEGFGSEPRTTGRSGGPGGSGGPDGAGGPGGSGGAGGPGGPGDDAETAETVGRLVARWPAPGADSVPLSAAALAGLGLLLHDRCHGTTLHAATVAPWWDAVGPGTASCSFTELALLAPQFPDDVRRRFDATALPSGPDAVAADPVEAAGALLLARSWGLTEPAAQLHPALDEVAAPAWDDERGELTRPAADAAMAMAEATVAGAWTGLFGPLPTPSAQLVDVDFPRLALQQAEWRNDCLVLRLATVHDDASLVTSFRLVGSEPRVWCMTGLDRVSTEVTGHGVIVRVPLVGGSLEFTPGSY